MHVGAALLNKSTIFSIWLNAKVHIGQLGCVSIMTNRAVTAQNAVYHNLDSRIAICGCFSYISARSEPRWHALRSVASKDGYARSYIGCSAVRNICAHVTRCKCKISDSLACENVVRRRVRIGSSGTTSPEARFPSMMFSISKHLRMRLSRSTIWSTVRASVPLDAALKGSARLSTKSNFESMTI